MLKLRKKIKDKEVLLIDLLDSHSLEVLNSLFNTTYSHKSVRKNITVKRAEKEPSFWKKLMTQRTGVRD